MERIRPDAVVSHAPKLYRGQLCGRIRSTFAAWIAAFANPEIYEFLEAEGYGYAIRLPTNPVLQGKSGYLLKRPVGRPPHEVRRYLTAS